MVTYMRSIAEAVSDFPPVSIGVRTDRRTVSHSIFFRVFMSETRGYIPMSTMLRGHRKEYQRRFLING